jgi:hypothetical protein
VTRRAMEGVAVLATALFGGTQGTAVTARAPAKSLPAAVAHAPGTDRHHYTMSARVRPLLLSGIGRSNIGDAIITRAVAPNEARYSLLVGSDPDRAPRRINRWGYIEERICGDAATVVGLMSESDDESVGDAKTTLPGEGSGLHTFNVIQADIDSEQSRSSVTAVGAPADYSFRQVQAVLALAGGGGTAGKLRIMRLPQGTRPGFLSALAEMIHAQAVSARVGTVHAGAPLTYVYNGKFYELRGTSVQFKPTFEVNSSRYARVVSGQFAIRNLADGEETRFGLSFGIDGGLAEVPLTISFQPRWWMQVNLVLADNVDCPLMETSTDDRRAPPPCVNRTTPARPAAQAVACLSGCDPDSL